MASRHAQRDDFFLIAEEFPRRVLLDLLGIDRRTLRRWRAGAARIPWAAYQLVRDRSQYGLAERDAMEGFNRSMLCGLVESLRARVAALEAELLEERRKAGARRLPGVDFDRQLAAVERRLRRIADCAARALTPREADREADEPGEAEHREHRRLATVHRITEGAGGA